MNITTKDIELVAPNAEAAKNGRDLVAKKKLAQLSKSPDGTLIFGECAGSGKNPYYCSADYVDESSPVFRCSCPSRQIPCKHVLGLLYAYADGLAFGTADIPEDVASKREKIEKRQEKKELEIEVAKAQPLAEPKNSKAKLNALVKKTEAQLNGIEMADKLLKSIVQMGLAAVDAKMQRSLNDQIKQLGNYYIGGVQTAFSDLLLQLSDVRNEQYTKAIDQVNYIYALLKKSRDYLTAKKEHPESTIELNSAIEEQIGYAWKLTELLQHGLWEKDAELVQLSFYSYDDAARREYVDEGYWMNLHSGRIFKTKNYRPYKAKNYVKEENSFFYVLQTKELFIYPGDINPRARWNDFTVRDFVVADLAKVRSYAATNFAELVKAVKGSIKNPLTDKNPIAVIQPSKVYKSGAYIVVEDEAGTQLTLKDISYFENTVEQMLAALLPTEIKGICMTVMFENDIETGLFAARPLSLLTPTNVVRLLY